MPRPNFPTPDPLTRIDPPLNGEGNRPYFQRLLIHAT
jgi:hypothetical protein